MFPFPFPQTSDFLEGQSSYCLGHQQTCRSYDPRHSFSNSVLRVPLIFLYHLSKWFSPSQVTMSVPATVVGTNLHSFPLLLLCFVRNPLRTITLPSSLPFFHEALRNPRSVTYGVELSRIPYSFVEHTISWSPSTEPLLYCSQN